MKCIENNIFKEYSIYSHIWKFNRREWNDYEGMYILFAPKHSSKKWKEHYLLHMFENLEGEEGGG